jgi:hypothetical protein
MLKTTNKTIKPLANHEMQTEWGVEKRNRHEERRKNEPGRAGRVLYYNVSDGTLNNIFLGGGIKFCQ